MTMRGVNVVSAALLVLLSLTLLVNDVVGIGQPPLPDEGTQAHIFQLSVAAIVPVIALYAATFDWSRSPRTAWPLALAGVALGVSFGLVYYIEHH